jgi:hypothetical protein
MIQLLIDHGTLRPEHLVLLGNYEIEPRSVEFSMNSISMLMYYYLQYLYLYATSKCHNTDSLKDLCFLLLKFIMNL